MGLLNGTEAEEAWRQRQTQRPIESENWKLNIEEKVVGLPLWKGKEAWFFLVPEGRFSGRQEADLNIDKKLKDWYHIHIQYKENNLNINL